VGAGVDRDAEIFRDLYPGLRRFAAVCLPLHIDPDDLVQEATARTLAIRPLHQLDRPGAYLRTAIVNLVRNRARDRESGRLDHHRAPAIADVYPSDLSPLSALSADERAVLFLVDVERCSRAEAGAILGWSAGEVRWRLDRARRRLTDVLTEEMWT
jgi:DNA-directed RNA polymerase specialized sigma24 family protein